MCLFVGEDILFNEEIHQVATRQIFHDKVEVFCVLKGAFESDDPGIFLGNGKNISFFPGLDDFVFENHLGLFEFFDCNGFSIFVPLAESNFSKGSFSNNLNRRKIAYGEFISILTQNLCLFVQHFLLQFFLFFEGHVEHLHFSVELLPVLLFLLLLLKQFGVPLLDVALGCLDFFLCVIRYGYLFDFIVHSNYKLHRSNLKKNFRTTPPFYPPSPFSFKIPLLPPPLPPTTKINIFR